MMWFTYCDNVSSIPMRGWHYDGLGWEIRDRVSFADAKSAKLLQWNGDKKPWMDSMRIHYPLWSKYLPTQCNGLGVCKHTNDVPYETYYKCTPHHV